MRVVAMGGGTGLSTLLRGLKTFVADSAAPPGPSPSIRRLTAIVTVTDEGGSSGRLRREFGMLPPGDIRNCLVALAEDEQLLTRLFRYRFSDGRGLAGHSFGNLFLAALTHLLDALRRPPESADSRRPAAAGRVEDHANPGSHPAPRDDSPRRAPAAGGAFGH